MKTIETKFGYPGEFTLTSISYEDALKIAEYFYDVKRIVYVRESTYAVETLGGFDATIGTYKGDPAIIHKINPDSRRMNILLL